MSISEFLTQYGDSFELILISLFIGILIALCVLVYNKYGAGRIVRYLIENGIHTADDAVTLEKAGLARSVLTRFALREGSTLRKLIVCLSDEKNVIGKKGREDLRPARFYLPEDKSHRAEMAYNNNGASILAVFLAILLFLIMLLLTMVLVPEMITLCGNFIDMFRAE